MTMPPLRIPRPAGLANYRRDMLRVVARLSAKTAVINGVEYDLVPRKAKG